MLGWATGLLAAKGGWIDRIRGIRANASRRSHAELNEAPDLDAGNPVQLGSKYRALLERHPHINVLGGCCGTDHRHVGRSAQPARCRNEDRYGAGSLAPRCQPCGSHAAGVATAAVLSVSALAAFLPARLASLVDPAVVLRNE